MIWWHNHSRCFAEQLLRVHVSSPSSDLKLSAGEPDATVASRGRRPPSPRRPPSSLPLQPRPLSWETSTPGPRPPCRRRSAGRSRGKWPRRRRSSRWRWSARTAAPGQSSETEGSRGAEEQVSAQTRLRGSWFYFLSNMQIWRGC